MAAEQPQIGALVIVISMNFDNMKQITDELPKLNAEQAARQLFNIGYKSVEYENGVQAERKDRLKTFQRYSIPYLIEQENDLIAYGEEVLKLMREMEQQKV